MAKSGGTSSKGWKKAIPYLMRYGIAPWFNESSQAVWSEESKPTDSMLGI